METATYNLYSIVLSTVTLLVTAAGLYAVFVQIQKVRIAAWSNMHSKLCDQSFELLKFLSEYPNTYDYFYYNKPLKPDTPDRVIVLYLAEALANFLEHLLLQQKQLPPKQWAVWRRFIYSMFDSSVVIRQLIIEHYDWYSSDLVAVAREYEQAQKEVETVQKK